LTSVVSCAAVMSCIVGEYWPSIFRSFLGTILAFSTVGAEATVKLQLRFYMHPSMPYDAFEIVPVRLALCPTLQSCHVLLGRNGLYLYDLSRNNTHLAPLVVKSLSNLQLRFYMHHSMPYDASGIVPIRLALCPAL
jgi:hypothetical protein